MGCPTLSAIDPAVLERAFLSTGKAKLQTKESTGAIHALVQYGNGLHRTFSGKRRVLRRRLRSPAAWRLDPEPQLQILSRLAFVLGKVMPVWYPVSALLLDIQTWLYWHMSGRGVLLAADAIWILASVGSIIFLVPLNTRVANGDADWQRIHRIWAPANIRTSTNISSRPKRSPRLRRPASYFFPSRPAAKNTYTNDCLCLSSNSRRSTSSLGE